MSFFSFNCKFNQFGMYTRKGTFGIKWGMRCFCHLAEGGKQVWIALLLGWGDLRGRLLDAIHRAPCSIGVQIETTHIRQVKFDLRKLPNMIVNYRIKWGLIVW